MMRQLFYALVSHCYYWHCLISHEIDEVLKKNINIASICADSFVSMSNEEIESFIALTSLINLLNIISPCASSLLSIILTMNHLTQFICSEKSIVSAS